MKKNIKKLKAVTPRGFTVLEFLVVIAMMGILISLVLVGLSRARSQSRDQGKVSEIQKIVIGLEQYYDICGEYPENLTGSETCPSLNIQGKTISDIIPEVASMNFNQLGPSTYFYLGTGNNCSAFHIGTFVESPVAGFQKSGKDSTNLVSCGNQAFNGIDASGNNPIVDIWKEK